MATTGRFFAAPHGPADQIACIGPDGRGVTHAGLCDDATRLSQAMVDVGVVPGQRVATLLPDTPATALALCCLTETASVLPLNPGLAPPELRRMVAEAGAEALISAPGMALAETLTAEAGLARLLLRPTGEGATGSVLEGVMPRAAQTAHAPGLVLLTSGSTGSPKRVPLDVATLHRSAKSIAAHLALGPDDRALHALPMFHIGALVDLFLAPLMAGGAVIVAPGPAPGDILGAARAHGATWLQLVPTMLARLLEETDPDAAARLGAELRFIRSVSADLAPDQHARAEAFFGGTPIIQMYGMTETAGQIASNPLPPAPRKPGSVGRVTGPELALLDATGARVASGAEGEICLRGPTVMAGYEGADRAEHFHGDWLRSGDLGRLDDDGYLFLTGRLKDMINRGGEKISPVEIERAALGLPGVTEAACFARPHPTLGEQVGLAVVAPGLDEAAVLRHLAGELAEFKRPRAVRMMAALPRLGSGKLDRITLARQEAEAGGAPKAMLLSTTGDALAALWGRVLGNPPAHEAEDFFDAGGDSLAAVEFMAGLEAHLAAPPPPNLLFNAPRFGDLVAAVEGLSPAPAAPEAPVIRHIRARTAGWPGQRADRAALITGIATVGEAQPVFVCAQAIDEIRPFQRQIGPDHPVYMMRSAHGFAGKDDALNRDLAQVYAREIDVLQAEGDLVFIGVCEGAKLLRMVGDLLVAQGRNVAFMVSFDYWFNTPTAWPVLHVMSESRRHSARMKWHWPERAFALLHPRGAAFTTLPGNHEHAITDAGLDETGQVLRAYLCGDRVFTPFDTTGLIPLAARAARFRGRIGLSAPRLFRRAEPVPVTVRVTNEGTGDWPASAGGGPTIVAHWRNLDLHCHAPSVAAVDLPAPVPRGACAEVELSLSYPSKCLPQILEVGLMDEGIGALPGARARRLVWASRS